MRKSREVPANLPKIPLVKAHNAHESGPQVGDSVAVVVFKGDSAKLAYGEVVRAAPFEVMLLESDAAGLSTGSTAMLISRVDAIPWRSGTTIKTIEKKGGLANVCFEAVAWKQEDRRRHPRLPIEVPIALKLVQEQESDISFQEAQGKTVDISLGGAAVQCETPVPTGTLVEFRWTSPKGESLRTLAVVMHEIEGPNYIGIEFVHFIGEGQAALESLLQKAA